MITLYIPTTTLNFNNILSSESISPKAFYERREFGYRRWAAIEENGIENATILYDKLPSFSRPDNGLEDHPLVVQVVLNENQVKTIGNGVFYCDKTIYLDPWHTKFIFQSERDKRTTLSMSDSSSETKLLHLYRNQLEVRIGQSKYEVPKNSDIILNKPEITNDFSFNRIKGLLYGYYIGANMSLSKDDVEEIVEMRELQDILSSIQSSDDHVPSSFQKERLHQLLRLAVNLYDNDIRNGKMLDLAKASVSWLEKTAAQNKKLLLPESNEIEISEGQLSSVKTIIDCKEKELFKAWTEFLFSFDSNKYNGKISTINTELSDKLTVIAKGVYGDDWEGSYAKRFLNNLRRHIRGEAFDEQWDNGLLSSIAAVLTHGDDWHKLLSFMQSKGMYDYRLAFAFYGLLNGFANLTRDFTDNLFEQNSSYVLKVYREFYKQLFGKVLEEAISKSSPTIIEHISIVKELEQNTPIETDISEKSQINPLKNLYDTIPISRKYQHQLESLFSETKKINDKFLRRVESKLKGKKGIIQIKNWIKGQTEPKFPNYGTSNTHFVSDPDAWDKIKDLIPIEDQSRVYDDYHWFVGEMRKEPRDRKYYQKINSTDDERVIDAFVNLKKKKEPYPMLRKKIKDRLLSIYCK